MPFISIHVTRPYQKRQNSFGIDRCQSVQNLNSREQVCEVKSEDSCMRFRSSAGFSDGLWARAYYWASLAESFRASERQSLKHLINGLFCTFSFPLVQKDYFVLGAQVMPSCV